MNIQYSNVRQSHMVTAQLITDSICFDLLKETDNDKKHEKFAEDYWYKVALIIAQYSVKCRRDLIPA